MPATIKDLAEALNLATSTISRALSDHPDISTKTKEKVIEAAKELNYQRNFAAAGLRTRKSNAIGVLIPKITNPFFSLALDGIHKAVNEMGYYTIVCQSEENAETEQKQLASLLSCQVEGIILSLSGVDQEEGRLNHLNDLGIPFVFFDRISESFDSPSVQVDDFKGGYMATEHLLQRGARRIAHIGGPAGLGISDKRYKGYLAALQKHGIAEDKVLVHFAQVNESVGPILEELLRDDQNLPDAIFTFSDDYAVEAIAELKRRGVRIPEEVSVVGFGNHRVCDVVEPNLTSITQEPQAMGTVAAEILFKMLRKKPISEVDRKVMFQPELVVRDSS